MRICFSGAELFLQFLAGTATPDEIFAHPAYQAVQRHAKLYGGNELGPEELAAALRGEASPFYGLGNIPACLPQVHELLSLLRERADAWSCLAQAELNELLPSENLTNITVYPIIGYDAGIGLSDSVCMALNWRGYLASPGELLSTIIHEAFHVIYERIHGARPIGDHVTPADWQSLFCTMLQNEGYAVYAPMRLRQRLNYVVSPDCPLQADYLVLQSETEVAEHITLFRRAMERMMTERLTAEGYLSLIFSNNRLTYRVGAELVRRIERTHGMAEVRKAVYLTGLDFYTAYQGLLS